MKTEFLHLVALLVLFGMSSIGAQTVGSQTIPAEVTLDHSVQVANAHLEMEMIP